MDPQSFLLFNSSAIIYYDNNFNKSEPCLRESFIGNTVIQLRDKEKRLLMEVLVNDAKQAIEENKYGPLNRELKDLIPNAKPVLTSKYFTITNKENIFKRIYRKASGGNSFIKLISAIILYAIISFLFEIWPSSNSNSNKNSSEKCIEISKTLDSMWKDMLQVDHNYQSYADSPYIYSFRWARLSDSRKSLFNAKEEGEKLNCKLN